LIKALPLLSRYDFYVDDTPYASDITRCLADTRQLLMLMLRDADAAAMPRQRAHVTPDALYGDAILLFA